MGETRVTWYVFVKDIHTNEVVSRELPGENANRKIMSFDGKKWMERELWECSGSFVTRMLKEKDNPDLHFEIYKKNGKNGFVVKAKFLKPKRKKK